MWTPEVYSTKDTMTSYVALLFSLSKVGKTTTLRDCDLILNALGEDGLASISDKDIPAVDITAAQTTADIFGFLTTDKRATEAECIGIDGFSWLCNKLFVKRHLGLKRKTMTWGDWDILGSEIDDFVVKLKSLKKEVICTALEQIVKEEASGKISGVPDVGTRNYSTGITALFDCVIRLTGTVVDNKYKVMGSLMNEGLFVSGVRKPMGINLGTSVDLTNQSIRDFFKTLKGGVKNG